MTVIRSHNKICFSKISKLLAELNEVFNFEKFLIYLYQNLIESYVCWLVFIFLIGNLTQNVYSSKFSHVNNEFNVTNE